MPSLSPSSARAFPSSPRVDRYFASEAAEAARRRLTACVERGEGPALLIAAAGCGKSTLVEVLATALAERFRVVRLTGAQVCTRRALLQAVLHGLGEDFRGMDDGEMRLAVEDAASADAAPIAVLVDEAQALPVRLLEELRLMGNHAPGGEPTVRVVLAGTNTLDETFTAPELESFSQRIAARCYLAPMTRAETIQYVRAHVAAVGGDPDALFTPDAFDALFRATDGTPRLINQLGDRALVLAVERGERLVTGEAIQDAWSDLHQLPAPWHTPAVVGPAIADEAPEAEDNATVRFDGLDDDLVDTELDHVEPAEAEPPAAGVWNADAALEEVASGADAPPTSDDASVAYALPMRRADDEAGHDPAPAEFVPDEPVADAPTAAPTAVAADPFDEAFDEEEVVLDRQNGVESVLRPGAACVENVREVEFGRMFQALSPAVESLIDEIESSLTEAQPEALSIVESEDAAPADEAGCKSCDACGSCGCRTSEEEPMLLVEEERPTEEPAGEVTRREYARLFTSLRQA